MPRCRSARSRASAAYFFPTAQSVPTVSNRLPERLRPEPVGNLRGGTRTSSRRRPWRSAAARNAAKPARGVCRPLATSMPRSTASTRRGHPRLRQHAPRTDGAKDERPRTPGGGLRHGHVRQAMVRTATRQPKLSEAAPRPPIDDALPGFRGERVLRVPGEEQIGRFDAQRLPQHRLRSSRRSAPRAPPSVRPRTMGGSRRGPRRSRTGARCPPGRPKS